MPFQNLMNCRRWGCSNASLPFFVVVIYLEIWLTIRLNARINHFLVFSFSFFLHHAFYLLYSTSLPAFIRVSSSHHWESTLILLSMYPDWPHPFIKSDKSFPFTSDATNLPPFPPGLPLSFPPPYLQWLYNYIRIKNANGAGASQSLGWPILQLMMGHSVERRAGMKENLNEADPHTKARPVEKACSLPTK